MNIADIIQLIILCAVIFIPFGYALRPRLPHIIRRISGLFCRAKYIKPAGVRHRSASAGVKPKHD
ncbi:cellulose biosynthesis protein BcsF [Shimwellia pseudoproteus]|uniref:cellulose biosynthesis protein BcsF n=1 Tax=Shimwellia pseudoproteus TaxID=570012 RepID=UPI0018EDEEB2|nr:cellulose biosynthesis protein BcsF [Shimwellia pseudoproteus]MBJ3814279.1 cellulose biosynthesis protein BcsF [Shimwellia pseudoproteus]